MLHAVALHWPDVKEQNLWSYALSYAAYLHNQTPSQQSGLVLVQIWTKTKSTDLTHLQNLHVWGLPADVLDPTLHDGSNLPKWSPQSQWWQYMGQSSLHASTVGPSSTYKLETCCHNSMWCMTASWDQLCWWRRTTRRVGRISDFEEFQLCSWWRSWLHTSTARWVANSGRMTKSKARTIVTAAEPTTWTEGATDMTRTRTHTSWRSIANSYTSKQNHHETNKWRQVESKRQQGLVKS